MYRFFVKKDQIQEDAVIIIGSDVNHIKNVLRMKKGEATGKTGNMFVQ